MSADLRGGLIVLALTILGLLIVLTILVLRRTEPKPRAKKFKPVPRREVTPAQVAADPLLTEIAAMLAYHHLHVGWVNGYEFRKLTAEQKELWADLIDANHVNDPADPDDEPWLVARWWREDYTGPLPSR